MKTGPDFRMIKCCFHPKRLRYLIIISPGRSKHITGYVSPEDKVCFSYLLMTDTETDRQLSIRKSQAGSLVCFSFIH